jgi:uncharacterized protein (TIGR02118 family)
MIKAVVMYGHPTNVIAFERHYQETHLPLAAKIPGVQRIELDKVVGTPDGSKPPYYRIAELYAENQEALDAAMQSPEGKAAMADIPNFASGGVTVMVCAVERS